MSGEVVFREQRRPLPPLCRCERNRFLGPSFSRFVGCHLRKHTVLLALSSTSSRNVVDCFSGEASIKVSVMEPYDRRLEGAVLCSRALHCVFTLLKGNLITRTKS